MTCEINNLYTIHRMEFYMRLFSVFCFFEFEIQERKNAVCNVCFGCKTQRTFVSGKYRGKNQCSVFLVASMAQPGFCSEGTNIPRIFEFFHLKCSSTLRRHCILCFCHFIYFMFEHYDKIQFLFCNLFNKQINQTELKKKPTPEAVCEAAT